MTIARSYAAACPRFLDTDHARRSSCFIGANGPGKTALLNMLIGMLPRDSDTVKLGTNLAAVLRNQPRETLDPEPTLTSSLTIGAANIVSVAGQSATSWVTGRIAFSVRSRRVTQSAHYRAANLPG